MTPRLTGKVSERVSVVSAVVFADADHSPCHSRSFLVDSSEDGPAFIRRIRFWLALLGGRGCWALGWILRAIRPYE
jgi:hypothetical protein